MVFLRIGDLIVIPTKTLIAILVILVKLMAIIKMMVMMARMVCRVSKKNH